MCILWSAISITSFFMRLIPCCRPKSCNGTLVATALVVDIVNGTVEDVRVLKSGGDRLLDEAAVAALRQWRFRPHVVYKMTIPLYVGARLTLNGASY